MLEVLNLPGLEPSWKPIYAELLTLVNHNRSILPWNRVQPVQATRALLAIWSGASTFPAILGARAMPRAWLPRGSAGMTFPWRHLRNPCNHVRVEKALYSMAPRASHSTDGRIRMNDFVAPWLSKAAMWHTPRSKGFWASVDQADCDRCLQGTLAP